MENDKTKPSHDDISRTAYAIAESRGFGQGQELDDWFEVERLLGAGNKTEGLNDLDEDLAPQDIVGFAESLGISAEKLRYLIEKIGPNRAAIKMALES